ncbi:MAG: hypothetical protein WAU70_05160 [Flavobacteriales bacterium]
MRSTTTTALTTALFAAWGISTDPVNAQDLAYANTTSDPVASAPSTTLIRTDLVTGDLVTLATRRTKEPLARTVWQRADGLYDVRIVDATGQARMEGSYRDSDLRVPHGDFRYYHANGRLESSGTYNNGRKQGVWQCASADGRPRADRFYNGLEWDELQLTVGLATRAN